MALTEGALYTVRNWIGDEPSDLELEAQMVFAGSLRALVWGVLRRRLTEFEIDPASFSAGGLYTQNAAANMEQIRKDLERLRGEPDDLGWDDADGTTLAGMVTQQVVRRGYRR
jgi:hypothetical protein